MLYFAGVDVIKSQDLNERSLYLLKTLGRALYTRRPTGRFAALSKDPQLKLSPASIRNVMADLEDMGLIHSPHTSAGRVPTVSGYRLFVDSLLTVKPLASAELDQLQSGLNADEEKISDLVGKASKLLSDVTQMAGVVTLPRRESVIIAAYRIFADVQRQGAGDFRHRRRGRA